MKFQIDSIPEDLGSIWVHVKKKATLSPKPYLIEVPQEDLESQYKGIKEENEGWDEFFREGRKEVGDNLLIGGIIEHAVGEEKPENFKYVIATVDLFSFENGLLRISGQVEDFEPSQF